MNADKRSYRVANRETVCQQERERTASDLPAYLCTSAKHRAKKRNVPFSLTPADIVIPTHCPVLGIRLVRGTGSSGVTDTSPTLDRLVPALGYTAGNIRVISGRANRIKNDATAAEVRAVLAWMEAEGLA